MYKGTKYKNKNCTGTIMYNNQNSLQTREEFLDPGFLGLGGFDFHLSLIPCISLLSLLSLLSLFGRLDGGGISILDHHYKKKFIKKEKEINRGEKITSPGTSHEVVNINSILLRGFSWVIRIFGGRSNIGEWRSGRDRLQLGLFGLACGLGFRVGASEGRSKRKKKKRKKKKRKKKESLITYVRGVVEANGFLTRKPIDFCMGIARFMRYAFYALRVLCVTRFMCYA